MVVDEEEPEAEVVPEEEEEPVEEVPAEPTVEDLLDILRESCETFSEEFLQCIVCKEGFI